MFLTFEATLFSALSVHFVLSWSIGIFGINCNVRLKYIQSCPIFKCQHQAKNGDQFGNRSQTLKNCCKAGESRESVNSDKMPQNGPGGNFTALWTLLLVTALGIVKNSKFCMSLCCIPVNLFLKFEATLFSALHLCSVGH